MQEINNEGNTTTDTEKDNECQQELNNVSGSLCKLPAK